MLFFLQASLLKPCMRFSLPHTCNVLPHPIVRTMSSKEVTQWAAVQSLVSCSPLEPQSVDLALLKGRCTSCRRASQGEAVVKGGGLASYTKLHPVRTESRGLNSGRKFSFCFWVYLQNGDEWLLTAWPCAVHCQEQDRRQGCVMAHCDAVAPVWETLYFIMKVLTVKSSSCAAGFRGCPC